MIQRLLKDQLLAAQGLKYSFLQRRANVRKTPIKLYWWHDHGAGVANFGDEITKDLLLAIFGYRSVFASKDDAELIGAGSILEIVSHRDKNNMLYVWGSGFMWSEAHETGHLDNLDFCAVRGTHTLARIETKKENVAIGDPGLLASIVYKRAKHQTNKIGVVAHFVDSDEPLVQELKKDTRFMVIDVLDSPEAVALNITSCKFILSSSLHGLIFADSFNIPNAHVQFSTKVAGGTYKFEDYYSATKRPYRSADSSKILNDHYLDNLAQSYQPVYDLRGIQQGLVRSFPNIR